MGDRTEESRTDRILAFEDLDDEERIRVEQDLQDRPEWLEHLARLRGLEQSARDPVPFQDGRIFDAPDLDESAQAAERESLRSLRMKLGLDGWRGGSGGGPLHGAGERRRGVEKWAPWLGAMAAVLLLALILPFFSGDDALIEGLVVTTLDRSGAPVRSTGAGGSPAGVLVTGQAFRLEFELARDAHVVIVHLDPRGEATRVIPGPDTTDFRRLEGGRSYRFPSADSDEDWVLERGGGMESFLVAAHPGPAPDLALLDAAQARAALAALPRERALAELAAILADWGAEVALAEFEHAD